MNFNVSVIIPTYNRAHFLRESIESVLQQTKPVLEIIVVDDGSTDNTQAIVESLRGPIRYIRQQNSGAAAARNRGLNEAKGDWIAFQDSDDLWVENKNQVQYNFLLQNPHLDFVFSHMGNFGDQGNKAEPEILHHGVNSFLLAYQTDLRNFFDQLLLSNPIPTPTVIFRRDCLKSVGFFDETLQIAEDFEYWLRFATVCRLGFVNKLLLHRRIHGNNLISNRKQRLEQHIQALSRSDSRLTDLSSPSRRRLRHAIALSQYNLVSLLQKERCFNEAAKIFKQTDRRMLWPSFRHRSLFQLKAYMNKIFLLI